MARQVAAQPVRVVPRDRPGVLLILARILWAVLCWSVRHPLTTLILAGLGLLAYVHDWPGPAIAAGAGVVVLVGWRVAHRSSFRRVARPVLLGAWRRVWIYQFRWASTVALCGLTKTYHATEQVPGIVKLRSDGWRDRVLVSMVPGQKLLDWQKTGEALAEAFGAQECTVRRHRRGRVWVDFVSKDLLVDPIRALPVPESDEVNLKRLVIGKLADGSEWVLRLLGTHVLLVGATGSGKGSVLYSLIRAVAAWLRDGLVHLWVIDPKGGMELSIARPLFTRYEDSDPKAMADMLDQAVTLMRDRQARLKGVTRQHEPSLEEPLVLVVIDEMAALTAYLQDRETKRRISEALGLLLSQGRAVGVNVIAALQDPRKEVLPFRDLFPTRIALRLTEAPQVDMSVGDGARDRGALCDQIPEVGAEGTGYVLLDGRSSPQRVRAAYVTDDDIRAMAVTYQPGRPGPVLNPVVVDH